MRASGLMEILALRPDADIAVIEGDDYGHKHKRLSLYVSSEGEIIIQYWDEGGAE